MRDRFPLKEYRISTALLFRRLGFRCYIVSTKAHCYTQSVVVDLPNLSRKMTALLLLHWVRPNVVKTSCVTMSRIPAILPLRDSALEAPYRGICSWKPRRYVYANIYICRSGCDGNVHTSTYSLPALSCLSHWLRSSISELNRWDKRRFVRRRYEENGRSIGKPEER